MSSRVLPFPPPPRTAEEWLARVHAPDCSEADHEAFNDWLRADPRHRSEYEKCETVWTMPERVKADAGVVAELLAMAPAARVSVAAASKPRTAVWAAAATVALVAILAAWLPAGFWQGNGPSTITTAKAEQLKVTLADGTVVQLNPLTKLVWSASTTERRVELRDGEAFFSVTKDPSRPFIVRAGDTEVRVVGTQFAVRREGGGVEVVVREGQVDVVPDASKSNALQSEHVSLTPGKRLRVATAPGLVEVSPVDADRLTAWRDGSLEFDSNTLDEVVAQMNRFARRPLAIEDPALRELRISGRFQVGDTEALLFTLRERFAIQVDDRGDRILLKSAAS